MKAVYHYLLIRKWRQFNHCLPMRKWRRFYHFFVFLCQWESEGGFTIFCFSMPMRKWRRFYHSMPTGKWRWFLPFYASEKVKAALPFFAVVRVTLQHQLCQRCLVWLAVLLLRLGQVLLPSPPETTNHPSQPNNQVLFLPLASRMTWKLHCNWRCQHLAACGEKNPQNMASHEN